MRSHTEKFLRPWGLLTLAIALTSCSSLVTQKDKEKARLHLQLATERFNQKDFNHSIESVQEALKLDPSLVAAYNHLALIYLETKRYQKSEEAFRKALEMQPNYPEAFNNLGVLYNRQERYAEAIPYFEKALANESYRSPENAYTNLGYAYFRLGKNEKAKEAQEKALDISPFFCLAAKNLADVYSKEKNYKKSAEFYEKALTHCPLFQECQYKLGLVLVKQGKKKHARAQFEKLIERHKDGPFVERSNEVLKYLQP